MRTLKRLLLPVAALSGLLFHLVFSGAVVAAIHQLGPLAYPAYFGWSMFQSCLVLMLASHVAWITKRLTIDPKRLQKPFWVWIRSRGAFALVLAIVLLIGPITAALMIRFLALPERKAWLYAFITNLISTAVVVSVYLGLIDMARSFFASLAAR